MKGKKALLFLAIAFMCIMTFGQIEVEMLPFCSSGIERMPWLHNGILYFVGTNYDIYYTTFENGEWAEPEWLPGEINTSEFEINPCVIENDRELVMYFARYSADTDYDFYRSVFDEEKGGWTEGTLITELSTDKKEWDIWVNSDETVAYFTSGGTFAGKEPIGGRDIWRSESIDGIWSSPENLSFLNTGGDEWSVFVSPDGSIWFDSARDDSIGGYDIYRWDPHTRSIEHPGQHINTFLDERSLWTDGQILCFSGLNRPDGAGSYDIFTLSSPQEPVAEKGPTPEIVDAIAVTINDIRQRSEGRYLFLNNIVEVEGIAMVSSGLWHDSANYFAITDKSAGILIYAHGFKEPLVEKGDLVRVKGTLTTVGYTTDVNSLVISPSSPDDIEIIRKGETLPDPVIIFTDSAKSQLRNLEGSLVMIFGKISAYDNETITRGFWVTGPSDRDFDNVSSGMRVKFYEYAGIDISALGDGSFVAVQGVLIQDNEGEFYIRPTIDEDIREHTENRVLFLTTIARKDLLTPMEEELETTKGEEESRDLVLPENVEAITWLLSSDKDFFSSSIAGTSNGKEVFASLYKEKGTRTKNYPPAIYELVQGNVSSKIPFPGEAEYPYLKDNILLFAGRILPDDQDSDWDIFSYDVSTKEIKTLTSESYDQIEPVISPKKDFLLYSERREGKWFVVKQDLSSGERTLVGENARSPTLSPTGNDVAFQYWNGNSWDIVTLNMKTGNTAGILSSSFNEFSPVWSPHGTKLAFVADYRGETEVFVIDLFDYSISPATKDIFLSTNPFWLDENTLGFTMKTNLGWNLVKTSISPKEKSLSESVLSEDRFIVSPRFSFPYLSDNRILEIATREGYSQQGARLLSKTGSAYELSQIADNIYIIPDHVPGGLYSLEVFAESNGHLYNQLEENSVRIGHMDDSFTVIQITDLHLDLPGKPENMLLFERLMSEIREERPDLMLITGDLSSSALAYTTDWEFIKKKVLEYCDFPVFVVPGNHDTQRSGKISGIELWEEVFGPCYASFQWGSWHFIGLNTADSEYGFVSGVVSEEQMKWIAQELTRIGAGKILLFAHHNFYDDRWIFFEETEQRRELLELFSTSNVGLALFGHRHSDAIDYSLNTLAVTTKRAVETDSTLAYRRIVVEEGQIVELVEVEPKSSVIF
jgi:Icc-related predicted phosphoesterase